MSYKTDSCYLLRERPPHLAVVCGARHTKHPTHLPLPSLVGFILTSITMNPVGRILPGIAVISLEPSPPAAAAPGFANVASPGD